MLYIYNICSKRIFHIYIHIYRHAKNCTMTENFWLPSPSAPFFFLSSYSTGDYFLLLFLSKCSPTFPLFRVSILEHLTGPYYCRLRCHVTYLSTHAVYGERNSNNTITRVYGELRVLEPRLFRARLRFLYIRLRF